MINSNAEKVNDLVSELNSRFDDLGTNVTTNLEKYLTDFEQKLDLFINKSKEQSKMITSNDFKNQCDGFKTSIHESFEKLHSSSKFQLENIARPGEKIMKAIDDAIINTKRPS